MVSCSSQVAIFLLIVGAVCLGLPLPAEETLTFENDIAPLTQKYCVECHNEDRAKGDLNLDRFESTKMVLNSLAVWQRAGKRIEANEMPPNNRPQPTPEEKEAILKWIGSLKLDEADCDIIASEESMAWYRGYVMSRRLNRAEYENTLRDLLGIDVNVKHLFPADGAGGEGFDNNGSSLFLSAIQLEKYLQAADLAMEHALPARRESSPAFGNRRAGYKSLANRGQWTGDEALAAVRERLIPERPDGDTSANDAAKTCIRRFIERAWRRPVEPSEVDRLLGMFNQSFSQDGDYDAALKLAYKSALVSPHFLFLAEPEPDDMGNYLLGNYQFASRLSYFLWASMPDAELFQLAADGKLHDEQVLRAQIVRMLKDPKAKALGDVFASQWLDITPLGETRKPDEIRFPEFDAPLARAMREETALFFHHIIEQDRSIVELLDADYTFVNEDLAAIYGIAGVEGEHMRRVELADDARGGVIGMAAVLTTTSHPLRTSPVLRGKWVLENLLGEHVPPPPPNVEQLPEDEHHPDGLTLRARLEAHRKNPECASCHSKMDPIGFGMEHYDPIGRWRETQAGLPIDAQGELPSGDRFNGPRELKAILLARKDDMAQNLTRKMLGYALGRSLNRYDQCVVDDAMAAMKETDYRPSAMITEIVLSYPFRYRYSGGTQVASLNEETQ